MRAKLDAIKTFDPTTWASDEDEERLGLKSEPLPGLMPHFPADEPVPLTVKHFGRETVTLVRTWSAQARTTASSCETCPFSCTRTLEELEARRELECSSYASPRIG